MEPVTKMVKMAKMAKMGFLVKMGVMEEVGGTIHVVTEGMEDMEETGVQVEMEEMAVMGDSAFLEEGMEEMEEMDQNKFF